MEENNKYPLLKQINDYKDIKSFDKKQLRQICSEMRQKIIDISKVNDIHLSSNLGIVELSTMILKIFDIENDIILYDTGHQTYVHKMLTGRKDKIDTIRQEGSISGLMNMNESKYDHYSPGHSGNVLSVLSGMYRKYADTNKVDGKQKYINKKNFVAVIGDSAFANGLNFEALNDVAFLKIPIIIILNDNGMSISKSVGALSQMLTKTKGLALFHGTEKLLRKLFNFNKFYYWMFTTFNWLESRVVGRNIFQNLGYYYIGPIDGHNIKQLDKFIKRAKWFAKQGPVILHVKTKKGKGDKDSENDKFGDKHSSTLKTTKSIGMYMTDELVDMMKKYKNINVLNPAMTRSSNCEQISNNFPDRYFDVGISEEHAISRASGMALVGLKPYLYFYSTFLQRGYDQLLHDFARLKLNCTILLDRSDLSGGDGSSHHGIYDVGMLKSINNVLITSGRNLSQYKKLLKMSYEYSKGIFVIRYPRNLTNDYESLYNDFKFGQWELFEKNKSKTIIISYGPYVNTLLHEIYDIYNVNIANAIFITQYDETIIKKILNKYKNIIVYERIFNGSLVNDIYKYSNVFRTNNNIIEMNYKEIIENGSTDSLDKKQKMHISNIINTIKPLI